MVEDVAISAPIGGSTGLTKNGTGTLTLYGLNTYTGTSLLNQAGP